MITSPIRVPSHLGDAHADTRYLVRAEAEDRVGERRRRRRVGGVTRAQEARLSAAQSE